MIDIVCSDLDSTISNSQHRHHLTPPHEQRHVDAAWYDFAMASGEDTVMEGMAQTLRLLRFPLAIISGRSIEAYDITMKWLHEKAGLYPDFLWLKRPQDPVDNAEQKITKIEKLRKMGYNPILMFEDWPRVAQAIQEATGVPTVCVNPMYDDKALNLLIPEDPAAADKT